jgi:lipid-A-disaccharide synthase-like uncharacterized protein
MMDLMGLIGIIGALCILLAWMFEAKESVDRHKRLMDLRFAAVYFIGVVLLLVHSLNIEDWVFILLNMAIAVVVVFEIWYSLHIKKVHRKR